MKKKIVCLLLAIAVVMCVVPLTALAEGVPEEYVGSYEGERDGDHFSIKIFEDETGEFGQQGGYVAWVEIPEQCFGDVYTFWYSNDDGVFFGSIYDTGLYGGKLQIKQLQYEDNCYYVMIDAPSQLPQGCISGRVNKVSDSTNSTLSTGSNWIIPVVAGVLALGVVIYIGKRKKEKTE